MMTTRNLQPKKNWLVSIIVFIFILFPTQAWCGKLDLMAGYFSLEAEAGGNKGQVSTFGAYKVSYAIELFSDQLDLDLGYTLMMSNTFGGDLAYGIEAAVIYFPFSPSLKFEGENKNSAMTINPLWRPFVGGGFGQRQAQSTNSGYAGFGALVGVERALDSFYDFKAMLRYNFLSGPRGATATEMNLFVGITMPFSLGN